MKSKERVLLTFTRYRTPAGKPTCCRDIATDKQCHFLTATNLGTCDMCSYAAPVRLFRDDAGMGWIVPHKGCPLWNRKAKKVK